MLTLQWKSTLVLNVPCRKLKIGTHIDNGWMYRVYQNQAAHSYSSLYFFIFLSLQFWNIKTFCHIFLWNCEAYKVETWYTHERWVDASCILESDCCCLFVPLFFYISFSISKTLKISFTLKLWGIHNWNLVHMWAMGGSMVYTGIRLLLTSPFIFSFSFLSNFEPLQIFVIFFSGTQKLSMHMNNGWMYHV